jgi:regulator of nucleoside diphosphate kinase
MSTTAQFSMTDRDYAILRGIALARPSGQRGYFDLLRHKLVNSIILDAEVIDPDVVTMNTKVRYRIGDGRVLEHKLVIGPPREVIGETISLRSLHGLALLGMRDDQEFSFDFGEADTSNQRITVDSVVYQPEADDEVVDYGRSRMWRGSAL